MDTIMHYLTLVIPVIIILSGIMILFGAVTGWSRMYENSKNPQMQQQLQQMGKTKARITHGLLSVPMLLFGGWLLYCWLFGPIQK
ncbi:MAG: hypothetical protein MJ071_04910 [Oscillospiraceae bacterium]|nr:hypothetical protein [Oscillospiraceae bacterium]